MKKIMVGMMVMVSMVGVCWGWHETAKDQLTEEEIPFTRMEKMMGGNQAHHGEDGNEDAAEHGGHEGREAQEISSEWREHGRDEAQQAEDKIAEHGSYASADGVTSRDVKFKYEAAKEKASQDMADIGAQMRRNVAEL